MNETTKLMITELEINGTSYALAEDQNNIHNLAFRFNEDTQGITSLVIPITDKNEDDSIKPRAGFRALSFGVKCHADGSTSIAIGEACTTHENGEGAVAIGHNAQANGHGAISIGHFTTAESTGAIALGGEGTSAQGISSIAAGDSAEALANYTIALGRSVYAQNEYSVAIGSSLIATEKYATVLGKHNRYFNPLENSTHKNLLFALGNGFWYTESNKEVLETVPNELMLIEIYEQDIVEQQRKMLEEIGKLDAEAEDYTAVRQQILELYQQRIEEIANKIKTLQQTQSSSQLSQPGCALEVYTDGSAIWNSRRDIDNMSYTTQKYIVSDTDNELSSISQIVSSIKTDTFDLLLMGSEGNGKMYKLFGNVNNYYLQIYHDNDVTFYHYYNNEYVKMSVNNIGVEGGTV